MLQFVRRTPVVVVLAGITGLLYVELLQLFVAADFARHHCSLVVHLIVSSITHRRLLRLRYTNVFVRTIVVIILSLLVCNLI